MSFSKTDNTRYEIFKSGTGIPSKMDVTDEYLVVFLLFSYGILGVLRLQSRYTQTIVTAMYMTKTHTRIIWIVIRTKMYMTKIHKNMDSHSYRDVHDENPYKNIC